MTPKEIKKIAEEYANGTLTELSNGIDKDNAKSPMSDIENFLQHLTERFYLVEKGKVEEHYQLALEDSEEMGEESDEKVLLELLFGSEIGKEDGNERTE